jgi:histone-lysine N-methyltransferase SETMAR
VRQILNEYSGRKKVSAKMVPRLLTDDQKELRFDVCSDLQRRLKTIDETWCFPDDPERKRQNLEWKQLTFPLTKETRMLKSQMKAMLITYFDIKGTVHFEFITQGQTVTKLITWKY